ncbi:hypothetical protein AALA69_07735 [Eggerthellaceae bacterium 24-137]
MIATLVIDGLFKGMNDWRDAIQRSPHAGNDMARAAKRRAECQARVQMMPRFEKPVVVIFDWFEPNLRRDLDNVSGSARKWILDGLVAAGVLPDDGMAHVVGLQDWSHIDPLNPGVIVTLTDEIPDKEE